jgi:hypothetical protein
LKDPLVKGWWKIILHQKYSNLVIPASASPFMKGIIEYKNILDISLDWKVYNGNSISFWMDRWLLNTSLAHHYPYLFSIATDTQIFVGKAIVAKQLTITFKRQFVGVYYEEWCDI